jgi:hypothetical protein
VNVQVAVLPATSLAVEVTVVVPNGKVLPDAGTELIVTPGQLSLAAGANVTTAPHCPAVLPVVILAGQVMVGGWTSFTLTVNVHIPPPEAVAVTVVVPTGKNEPDAGKDVTGPHIPLVVGAG